jgi:hypothetical protein
LKHEKFNKIEAKKKAILYLKNRQLTQLRKIPSCAKSSKKVKL